MNKYRLVNEDISKALKKIPCCDLKKNLDYCLKLNEGDINFCYDMRVRYEECLKTKDELTKTTMKDQNSETPEN